MEFYLNDPITNLLGTWAGEINLLSILLRIGLSALFSAFIGCERASKRHAAGLRTFILASLAFLVWEFAVLAFPERFTEMTNSALKCSECTDKLCTQYCKKLHRNK